MDKKIMKKQLFEIFKELREQRMQKWRRVLPIGDEISDRWEKARFLKFGKGTSIYDSSLVIGDVKVGKYTWIGPFTILDGSGGLEIGDYCSIASGVQIYSHESVFWALSGGKMGYSRAKTKIGNFCYIGPNTIVNMGIRIGKHCLVGANSVVNKDLDDYSIATGVPCRVVGKVKVLRKGEVKLLINNDFREIKRNY